MVDKFLFARSCFRGMTTGHSTGNKLLMHISVATFFSATGPTHLVLDGGEVLRELRGEHAADDGEEAALHLVLDDGLPGGGAHRVAQPTVVRDVLGEVREQLVHVVCKQINSDGCSAHEVRSRFRS